MPLALAIPMFALHIGCALKDQKNAYSQESRTPVAKVVAQNSE